MNVYCGSKMFLMIYFPISIPPWLWWENHWLERKDCFGVFGVNVVFFPRRSTGYIEFWATMFVEFQLMTLPVCFSLEPAWLKRLKLSTAPWWTSGSLGVKFKVNSNQALWIFIIICYGSPPLVNDISDIHSDLSCRMNLTLLALKLEKINKPSELTSCTMKAIGMIGPPFWGDNWLWMILTFNKLIC